MPDETLLSAARRAVRFFNIDMNKGGLITTETEEAMQTLDKMVRQEGQTFSGVTTEAAEPEHGGTDNPDGGGS